MSPLADITFTYSQFHKYIYSNLKNPFHTNPNYGVLYTLPVTVGISLSFGGVINSTHSQLQNDSLDHVIQLSHH